MVTVTRDAQWRALAPLIALPAEWGRATRIEKREAIDAALSAVACAARRPAGGGAVAGARDSGRADPRSRAGGEVRATSRRAR